MPPIMLRAARRGNAVTVSGRAVVRAPYAVIWGTLTDYEGMPEFIPGVKQSRVVARRGASVLVEQRGRADLRLFSYPIRALLESVEAPPAAIDVRLVRGNLRQLGGSYRLHRVGSAPDHFTLTWSGVIEPALPLAGLIALPVAQRAIGGQFLALIREIERRAAQAGSTRHTEVSLTSVSSTSLNVGT